MLDNPILKEKPELMERALSQLNLMSENERNTRLSGDWYRGDFSVYDFNSKIHVQSPTEYNYGWRHVLSVDPAMSGNTGVNLWAEHPVTGVWYCMEAYYTAGLLSPMALLEHIEARHKHVNIVRRISDPHETWFIGTAAAVGKSYLGVYKKTERKKELIKNLQTALTDNKIKISEHCADLVTEFSSCEYNETNEEKIINATKYHLLDAAQYFWDNRLKFNPPTQQIPSLVQFEAELRIKNKARKKAETKRKIRMKKGGKRGWATLRPSAR